jgi:hypothetical protein
MASMLEAMLFTPDFKTEEERDAYLEKLYNKMAAKRTTRDPAISKKFHECLERSGAPKEWESLIRFPYIKGKPSHFYKRKDLPNAWEPGHEIKRSEDGCIVWHCLFVGPCDFFGHELNIRHTVQVWPDGKLIGESYHSGTGKIDARDVKQILEKWFAAMDKKEEQYWDKINDRTVKNWE